MLISTAYAQTGGGIGGLDFVQFLPIVLIFVVFYFLLIRPQQKKMKTHKDMLGALRRGDRVVTGGGIIGTAYYRAGMTHSFSRWGRSAGDKADDRNLHRRHEASRFFLVASSDFANHDDGFGCRIFVKHFQRFSKS